MAKKRAFISEQMKNKLIQIKPFYDWNKSIINITALSRLVAESKNSVTKRMLVLEVLDPEKYAEYKVRTLQNTQRANEKYKEKKLRGTTAAASPPIENTEVPDLPKMI